MTSVNRSMLVIQPALAQVAASSPQSPVPTITDDFVFSTDDWIHDKDKILKPGGMPLLNSLLAFIANDQKMGLTPGMLTFFQKHKNEPDLDLKSLDVLEARGKVMQRLVKEVLRKKIEGTDTVFTWDDWLAVKDEIKKYKETGGLAALNYFFWVLSRSNRYCKVDAAVKAKMDEFATAGFLNANTIAALAVYEEFPPPVAKPTLKDVRVRHRTKFDNQPVVIRIGECTRDFPLATIRIGTATVTFKNARKGKNIDLTIYEKGKAKEYIVGEWKGKMTMTVEDTGEFLEIEPEITIKGRPAPIQTFDLSQPTEEKPVELPVPTPKPTPTGKEAKFTIIKVEVDDESFRQYQMRAESKSPQGAGEELLRKSQGRIKTIFERALKKVPSWDITKVAVTLTVNSQGRVTRIKFVPNLDNTPEGFINGLRDIMKYWLFPAGGEVKFPLIFQASGG